MFTRLLSLILAAIVPVDPSPLERVGELNKKLIPEASGIVKSRRYPGIFWAHNDSGNPPLLFAINGDGRIVRQFRLAVPNVDWEDIAIDDHGHLYLGDIGNNGLALPVRSIYRIDEPDPSGPAHGPIAASAATFYGFQSGNRFDAEGLFFDHGGATLVAKYLDGREAELFVVPLEPPAAMFRPARPRLTGRLAGFTEPATGADLSADGTLLAVCSYAVTRVYRRDDREPPNWRPLAVVRYRAVAIEGVAWDGRDLALVAEGGGFYRLSEKTWRAASVPERAAPPSRSSERSQRPGGEVSRVK